MMASGCGHSFSKDSITTWLRQNHPVCPVCKHSLTVEQLVPNYALRSVIERYAEPEPSSPRQGPDPTLSLPDMGARTRTVAHQQPPLPSGTSVKSNIYTQMNRPALMS